MTDPRSRVACRRGRHERSSVARWPPAASTDGAFERAIAEFRAIGIADIEAVMTDNAWNYTRSARLAEILDELGAKHLLIKPHCPWQNGKASSASTGPWQTEWAYRQMFETNDERATALAPWLEIYNTQRRHSAIGGLPPISRLSPT